VVIILDIEQKKRREREKEIRASFLFWPQLCFFSLDDDDVCMCMYVRVFVCDVISIH
jgi:hypothetical protein